MTLTLQELATEVARQQNAKRDLIADTRRMSLSQDVYGEGDPRLVIDMPDGVEEFPINRYAHQQVAETVKMPWKFYERMQTKYPSILCNTVSSLFSTGPEEPGKPMQRMVRTLDGNVRAVLSDRYRPRDNADLLNHLLPILSQFPQVQFKACDLTETRLYVKTFIPGFERQVTPKVGDVVRGGVIISNSEIGAGSLYIYPYTDRLICSNGMVHTDFGQRRVHLGRRIEASEEAFEFFSDATLKLDDEAFFAKCADTLRGCLTATVFDAIVQQMRDLSEIQIDAAPPKAVETIVKDNKLTEVESDSIMKHLISGGDLSAWGFVNALTATARDLDDADRQTEIEMIAGKLTSDSTWTRGLVAA